MRSADLLAWLREDAPARLDALWAEADRVRREHVGDEVHLRGLVELSNHCVRRCAYCGISAGNRELVRYRMEDAEVLSCARQAAGLGYGTVVLQSGEDPALTTDRIAGLVRRIKGETGLAVTLSLGERPRSNLSAWRAAGADRYLLRFETSNPVLFSALHPPAPGGRDRMDMLRDLRTLGYEVGSGMLVGLPGQTWDDLAADLLLLRDLDLDMIGLGPFLPHPATPLAAGGGEVPATDNVTLRVLALARILRADANIPATTALRLVSGRGGLAKALARGANVVMPNLTPLRYRRLYEIYPAKAAVTDDASTFHRAVNGQIAALGRRPGTGPGLAPSVARRQGRAQ